jgi:hypothetical protein
MWVKNGLDGRETRLLLNPDSGLNSETAACLKWADSVAKVVLQKVSKIPRAAGAIFV